MWRASIIVLVGCSGKSDAPAPTPSPASALAPKPNAAPKNKLASVTATAPLEIHDVGFLPLGDMKGPYPYAYSVDFTATRDRAKAEVEAHVRCRVGGLNLVSLAPNASDHESASFYADPFDDAGKTCEVRFYELANDRESIVARACYRDGTLADGACPAGVFPPPVFPAGQKIDFRTVASPKRFDAPIPPIAMTDGNIQMSAIITVGEPLGEHVAAYKLRCEGDNKVFSVADTIEFVPVWRMEAGESAYAWEFILHPKDPPVTKIDRCELEILAMSRTAKTISGASLGRFCIPASGASTPGACTPAITGK